MTESVDTVPLPPLPYRARPPQVLLGVGAVLLVSAGAAVASAYGGAPARLLLFALAATAAVFSLRAARTGLTSSEETLAACATGLALAGRRPRWPGAGRHARHPSRPRGRLPGAAPGLADDGDLARGVLAGGSARGAARPALDPGRGAHRALPLRRPRRTGHRAVRTAGGRPAGPRDDGAVVAGRRRGWLVERLGRRRRPAVVLRCADDRRGIRAAPRPAARAAGPAAGPAAARADDHRRRRRRGDHRAPSPRSARCR